MYKQHFDVDWILMEGKTASYGRLTDEITSYVQIPITEDKRATKRGNEIADL
jgi:hypothetical protein